MDLKNWELFGFMLKYRKYKVVALVLSLTMSTPPIYANDYMAIVKGLLKESESLTRGVIEAKYHQSHEIWVKYSQNSFKLANDNAHLVNKELASINDAQNKMQSLLEEVSFENFKIVDHLLQEIEKSYNRARYLLEEMEVLVGGSGEILGELENFCSRYPNKIVMEGIKANPSNSKIPGQVAFTRYKNFFSRKGISRSEDEQGRNYFASDPMVEAHAVVAGGFAILSGGVLAYLYGAGIGITVTNSGLMITAAAATGTVAFAAISGTMVALAAVWCLAQVWTAHRNDEREEEARRKEQKLRDQYDEAISWYNKQKMTQNHVTKIAYEVCQSESFQKILEDRVKEMGKINDSSIAAFQNVQKALASLAPVSQTIRSFYENYKALLQQKYEARLIDDVERSNIKFSAINTLWNTYNQDIKADLMKKNKDIQSEKLCSARNIFLADIKAQTLASLELLRDLNEDESYRIEWEEVSDRLRKSHELMEISAKMTQCQQNGVEIYDF